MILVIFVVFELFCVLFVLFVRLCSFVLVPLSFPRVFVLSSIRLLIK